MSYLTISLCPVPAYICIRSFGTIINAFVVFDTYGTKTYTCACTNLIMLQYSIIVNFGCFKEAFFINPKAKEGN